MAALIATYMLNADLGIITYLLGRQDFLWLGDPQWAMVSIILLVVSLSPTTGRHFVACWLNYPHPSATSVLLSAFRWCAARRASFEPDHLRQAAAG